MLQTNIPTLIKAFVLDASDTQSEKAYADFHYIELYHDAHGCIQILEHLQAGAHHTSSVQSTQVSPTFSNRSIKTRMGTFHLSGPSRAGTRQTSSVQSTLDPWKSRQVLRMSVEANVPCATVKGLVLQATVLNSECLLRCVTLPFDFQQIKSLLFSSSTHARTNIHRSHRVCVRRNSNP